jgi:tRNA synthetases class II core domain (F)
MVSSTLYHPIRSSSSMRMRRSAAALLPGGRRTKPPLSFSKSGAIICATITARQQHTPLSSVACPPTSRHLTRRSSSTSSSSCSAHTDDGNGISASAPPRPAPAVMTQGTAAVLTELEGYPLNHPGCNVTSNIASRVLIQTKLHLQPHHPLQILHAKIQHYFLQNRNNNTPFAIYDNLSPIVSTHHNFDLLRIPREHISRSQSDTYYLNETTVLRTHTSAHQVDLLQAGVDRFLVTGDVYRRDEIDASHYPVSFLQKMMM